jgi:hypothetical protein
MTTDTRREPKPTSKTGYLDSPVYCETCNGSLYPSRDTGEITWLHVTPHPTQEWTPTTAGVRADFVAVNSVPADRFDDDDLKPGPVARAAFDRWLTAHTAEVERVARADERRNIELLAVMMRNELTNAEVDAHDVSNRSQLPQLSRVMLSGVDRAAQWLRKCAEAEGSDRG